MTEDATNLVLEHLRYIRTRLDSVEDAIQQLTTRFGALEAHVAAGHVSEAVHTSEIDRLKLRVDRIERRLELQSP